MQAEFGDRLQIVTRQLPADAREAAALGVRTLPTLFVNGKRLAGPVDEAMLRKAIDTATGRTLASQPTVLDVRTAATLGPAGGPEITVFSDFQCPYCGMLAPVLSQLAASGEARIRFKHFPLSFHIKAALAHKAAVAAGDQGKFWEMHDRIFAGQARLDRATFESYAADLKLDMAKFRAALDAKSEPTPVTEDLREGERIAVAGTPTIFINSRLYLGRPDLASIRAALKSIAPETQAPLPQLLTLYGPADAPLRLEWFFDAQSELTRDAAQELRRLMASRPAGLQIVARHRPLEFHPQAPMLHEALVAAESQGRFWELLEVIQRDPASATADRLPALALRAGLDERRFSDELSRRAGKAAVERDVADARTRGIRGTPAYYLNKKALTAIPTARELADAIRAESLQAQALIKETSR
jgi:protein-disulfide isomerase